MLFWKSSWQECERNTIPCGCRRRSARSPQTANTKAVDTPSGMPVAGAWAAPAGNARTTIEKAVGLGVVP